MPKRVCLELSDKLYKKLSDKAKRDFLTIQATMLNILASHFKKTTKQSSEFEEAFTT